jgi:hypothetical protein
MKRFIAAITSALGLSATPAPASRMVDPKTIFYSLATINGALPSTDVAAKPHEKDLVIHEDDWRQFEAISLACEAEMKEEIGGVQRIFNEKSKPSGEYRIFSEIHIRNRIVRPLPTPLAWTELLSAAGVQASAVSGVGLRDGQGMVRGGFSFHVGQLTVFGVRHGGSVEILCFGQTRTPSFSEEEAQKFAAFLEKSGVVVVHWPSATVFTEKQAMLDFLQQMNEK